jgi:hypothetical protein
MALQQFADQTPQSMGPSSLEQERGVASTPMDEGDLFATPSTTIRLSEVFVFILKSINSVSMVVQKLAWFTV